MTKTPAVQEAAFKIFSGIFFNLVFDGMANLHTFIDNPLATVENYLPAFKNGVYSSLASSIVGRIFQP